MRPEVLARIHELLQAPAGELEFLNKLSDEEGDILGRRLAEIVIHCGAETYTDTHWEDY
ncbi:MAG: hypothetical protein ACOY4L_11665 [Pseudomonadota bacterium]